MTDHEEGWTIGRVNARELQRLLYFGQRTVGDYNAAKRGRLVERLLRRNLTRSVFRVLR